MHLKLNEKKKKKLQTELQQPAKTVDFMRAQHKGRHYYIISSNFTRQIEPLLSKTRVMLNAKVMQHTKW